MSKKVTRRNFLSYLLVSAAAASFIPKYAFGNFYPNNTPENNWLSFSSQKGVGPWLDESTLMQQHTALHKETILPVKNIDQSSYRNTVSLLKKVLADHGIRWKKSNRIVWTYQHYGVSDSSIHSKRLLSYSTMAQDYLYRNVSGLMEIDLDWSLLTKQHSRSFVATKGYKGLIGKHTYLVYRVNAVDEKGEQILPGIVNIMPVERSINYVIDDDKHKPTGSTIFVIHGLTSLIAPFSELIHLTTHQPTLRFATKLMTASSLEETDAQMVGRIYGESISEAAGILLALSFLQKYGRTDEQSIVKTLSQNITQYPLVQGAMAYMKQNSVQQVLDAYSENPRRVMKEIKVICC